MSPSAGGKTAHRHREGAGITSGWYCIATEMKEPLPRTPAQGAGAGGKPVVPVFALQAEGTGEGFPLWRKTSPSWCRREGKGEADVGA